MARHCGLCYGTRHNRRTCPNATPQQKTMQASSTGTTYGIGTRKRNASRCSYCLRHRNEIDRTHNVRNCSKRREDAVIWTKNNVPFAESVASVLPKYGIGVGAIIKKSYDRENAFYIVTKVNWDQISSGNIYGAFSASALSEVDHEDPWHWRTFELPKMHEVPGTQWSDTVVINPLAESEIMKQIPNDFKFGYYGIPDKLRDKPRIRRRRQKRNESV